VHFTWYLSCFWLDATLDANIASLRTLRTFFLELLTNFKFENECFRRDAMLASNRCQAQRTKPTFQNDIKINQSNPNCDFLNIPDFA
jgi:hypothetical protein